MSEGLRIGIIGLGKMGRIRAATVAAHPETSLTAGADPDPASDVHFPGIKIERDWRAVIGSDVHAVIICTPNRITPEVVISALDAGKHVLCEKPPGRNLADIERIIAAEKRNPGLRLKFGFNHRYHAGIQEAKRLVESGRYGKILWLRGIYGKSGSKNFEHEWRNSHEMCGGGILLDQGIHMLDLFRFFCGDFVEVKSMCATRHWNIEVEDNAFALLRDAEGRIAMLHSSSTQWKHRFNLEIYMSEGYLSVNGILSSSRSYGEETISLARRQFDEGFATGKPREEIIYFDTDPSWELELGDFVKSIQEGEDIGSGHSLDALRAMQLVHAIYEDSGLTHQTATSNGSGLKISEPQPRAGAIPRA